jgi:hypothetical protein
VSTEYKGKISEAVKEAAERVEETETETEMKMVKEEEETKAVLQVAKESSRRKTWYTSEVVKGEL